WSATLLRPTARPRSSVRAGRAVRPCAQEDRHLSPDLSAQPRPLPGPCRIDPDSAVFCSIRSSLEPSGLVPWQALYKARALLRNYRAGSAAWLPGAWLISPREGQGLAATSYMP